MKQGTIRKLDYGYQAEYMQKGWDIYDQHGLYIGRAYSIPMCEDIVLRNVYPC